MWVVVDLFSLSWFARAKARSLAVGGKWHTNAGHHPALKI
jgi:hypothetical protein